jgi:hypothetical protein
MRIHRGWYVALAGCGLLCGLAALPLISQPVRAANGQADQAQPAARAQAAGQDPALERTRKQVKILDGIYKNAIVIVTEHYVTEKSDVPAGQAFKKLFQAAHDNQWHEVRLLDATGDPYEPENVPKSDFEKRAVKQLVAGEAYVDEVFERDGQRYLRAATAIPVVMKKCVMCHDNYADVPAGQAIGALGYTIAIE